MMTRFEIDGNPATMREAMRRFIDRVVPAGMPQDSAEDVFAVALYEGDSDFYCTPSHCRSLLREQGIHVYS